MVAIHNNNNNDIDDDNDKEYPITLRANYNIRCEIRCAYRINFGKQQHWITAGILVETYTAAARWHE